MGHIDYLSWHFGNNDICLNRKSKCLPYLQLSKIFIILLSGALLFVTMTTTVSAALTATTANTIEGTKPYLKSPDGTRLTDLSQFLGFSMWDGTYENDSETKHMVPIFATQTSAIIVSSNVKFNDILPLVTANGIAHSIPPELQGDDDGDTGSPLGSITATWHDNGKQIINLNQTLSPCGGPYTLTIWATDVSAKTTYGDPNINPYGNSGPIIYTFIPNKLGLCYIQPKSMDIRTGNAGVNIKYANGYNSAVWKYDTVANKHKGFSVLLMEQAKSNGIISDIFPTTGFKGATFNVIGSGNDQSNYRCKVINGEGKVSLTGNKNANLGLNCTVTYIAGTKSEFISSGTPTIEMEYFDGSTWGHIGSYTIPIPKKWALGGKDMYYSNPDNLSMSTTFYALDYCRSIKGEDMTLEGSATTPQQGASVPPYIDAQPNYSEWRQQFMYRRDELTSSPRADRNNHPENSSPPEVVNFFSRDIGAFMDEWGYVYKNYGNGSPWNFVNKYWTAEVWSDQAQFYVGTSGYVHHYLPQQDKIGAVCRGD